MFWCSIFHAIWFTALLNVCKTTLERMLLAVVCKRMQGLYNLLPNWALKLTVLREYQQREYLAYLLQLFPFYLASVLIFLLPFPGDYIIIKKYFLLRHYNDNFAFIIFDGKTKNPTQKQKIPHVHVAYDDLQLCISMETIYNARAWPQQCWVSFGDRCNILVPHFRCHGTKFATTGCSNGRNMWHGNVASVSMDLDSLMVTKAD